MLTYKEFIELKEKLTKGEISLDCAKELYNKHLKDLEDGKRSWHTRDWKERRNPIIKDKCERCGSTEVLTLQHRSHPRGYYEHEKDVVGKYTHLYIETNAIVDQHEFSEHVINNFDYIPVPLCPNCSARHPNKRIRKIPQYLCTKCHSEFDEPTYKTVDELISAFYTGEEVAEVYDKCFVSKNEWKNKQKLSQIMYWLQREKAKVNYGDAIYKEVLLLSLDDDIKYLSFEDTIEDTITACKKCAYYFDMKNMELCPKCKKNYKNIPYPTCIQCLSEDNPKAALENIEFGKKWRAMHEALGID